MAEGDQVLLTALLKLDLETKSGAPRAPTNPFMHRRRSKSLSSINFGSTCDCQKKGLAVKHTISFKKPNRNLLREPVLKLIKCSHNNNSDKLANSKISKKRKDKLFGHCSRSKEHDFRSIINACEQLNLSNVSGDTQCFKSASFKTARASGETEGNAPPQRAAESANVSTSCSHQARMNNMAPPCDVTIDELASYFETFVHIPKKMSSMAEMMYI